MKISFILLFVIFSITICRSQQRSTDYNKVDHVIYINDRFEKMDGYCNVSFIETFDTVASSCTFHLTYQYGNILSVKKYTSTEMCRYSVNQDGTVLFYGSLYYASNDFKDRHKQSLSVYNLIDSSFFCLNNKERFEILDRQSVPADLGTAK